MSNRKNHRRKAADRRANQIQSGEVTLRAVAPAPAPSDTSQEQIPVPTPPALDQLEPILERALVDHRAGLPVSDDVQLLAEMEDNIPRLLALLAEQEASVESREQEEATRAKTPLAMKLEVVGCRFATMIFPLDPATGRPKTIPEFTFEMQPCIKGKDQPDQDCRDCPHCQILPYGAHLAPHESRYPGHGMLLPIANEAQAEQLAKLVSAIGLQ